MKKNKSLESIEFFSLKAFMPAMQTHHGAVFFDRNSDGCAIRKIFAPVPSLQALYQKLTAFHESLQDRTCSVLYLKKITPSQFMEVLQDFCESGEPLPFQSHDFIFQNLTAFQKKCYVQTSQIPFGETKPYYWIASRIGCPRAVRAVGQALKQNPFPLLIPCHRVIKKDGQLGGFMGNAKQGSWEYHLKKVLLHLEMEHCQPPLFELPYYAAI